MSLVEMTIASASIWCFALTVVSALVPWVNAEVIVAALPAIAKSRFELGFLVMVATAGQMAGKCFLYWSSRSIADRSSRNANAIARWRARLEHRPAASFAFVFVSSLVGLPPFYLMTIVAGAIRMQLYRFVAAGACGRLVRFGIVAWIVATGLR